MSSTNVALLPFPSTPKLKLYHFMIKRNTKAIRCCKNSFESEQKNDVIIVGAGLAGSALAHSLAKEGRRVRVIERNLNELNYGTKRIAGELMQPAGYLKLVELGLEDCVKEIDAQRVLGFVMNKDGKSVRLPYPLEKYDSDVAGRCFHHARFVQKLREKASSLPNVVMEQGTVTSLIEEQGVVKGVRYKTRTGQESTAYAYLTIVCDGCFSSLRKYLSVPKVEKLSHVAGLIIKKNNQFAHENYAQIVMGNPVSLLLYPISSSELRIMIDRFSWNKIAFNMQWENGTFLDNYCGSSELYDAFISSIEEGEIKTMPISSMPATPCLVPGALLLGDALNMRHAITAGGMTVILHDVALFCNLFRKLNLNDAAAVTKCTQHFYNMRKPMALKMNVMADYLYKLLFASSNDELSKQIQQGCFNYFSLGLGFSRGLMGLLSGLNLHSWTLLLHFLAIVIYTTGGILLPIPTPKRAFAAARFLLGVAAVIPMVLNEVLKQAIYTSKALDKNM
ncbi:hypothetical protein ACJIZ3_010879 [Penstemon smallii]|uniref:Squalene monooxygenase n=1 Tax=Penstemon smallii TaxID=265156 RepID=A0ABD3UIY6_9LAMI